MKIKVDRSTLTVFNTITLYGLKQEFEDKMFQYFYSNSLQSLILKLARATMRISKSVTLQLSPSEIICYKWSMEFYSVDKPNSYEYNLSRQYFIEPVNKQISIGR